MGEEDKAQDCLKEARSQNPDSEAQIQGKIFIGIPVIVC
jgi:hypothetical protein